MSVRLTFNRLQGGRIPPSTVLPSFFSHLSPIGFLFSPPHRTKSGFQYDFLSFSPKKKNHSSSTQFFSPSPISIYIFIYFFPLTFRFCVYGPLSSSWWCRWNSRAENVLPGWNFDGENIFCLLFFQLSTCDCEFAFVLWRRKYSGICCKKRLSTRYLR